MTPRRIHLRPPPMKRLYGARPRVERVCHSLPGSYFTLDPCFFSISHSNNSRRVDDFIPSQIPKEPPGLVEPGVPCTSNYIVLNPTSPFFKSSILLLLCVLARCIRCWVGLCSYPAKQTKMDRKGGQAVGLA